VIVRLQSNPYPLILHVTPFACPASPSA
jgi:hypothetical protein